MQLMSSEGERVFDFSFIFDCYKTWGEIFSQSQSFALENQNNGKKKKPWLLNLLRDHWIKKKNLWTRCIPD